MDTTVAAQSRALFAQRGKRRRLLTRDRLLDPESFASLVSLGDRPKSLRPVLAAIEQVIRGEDAIGIQALIASSLDHSVEVPGAKRGKSTLLVRVRGP
jgi:hypothetical protein